MEGGSARSVRALADDGSNHALRVSFHALPSAYRSFSSDQCVPRLVALHRSAPGEDTELGSRDDDPAWRRAARKATSQIRDSHHN